ncbi:hypothetical protein [Defluviitalea raffinosedens]|uniref:hypothetical protein n=1 Tax=Defluviitalea raffinosedens TaxID=1450156 RepID=UPI001958DAE4|nr:hypothetical protein [Defluviitalea raffinosedens]
MAKYIVQLKQFTPMIHFQSEQLGATLRATELKPKLDKFLIRYAFNEDFEQYNKFLIGYKDGMQEKQFQDKKALNYKVHIRTNAKKIEPINLDFLLYKNLYLGNKGKKENKTYAVFSHADIEIEFFSFYAELIDIIKENIASFFALNNFGARQNKGFGSFYINNNNQFLDNIKKLKNQFLYIRYNKYDFKEMMKDIHIIYLLMKTGINFPESQKFESSYHKSFLFQYMLNKNIGNEKKFIKEKFFKLNHINIKNDPMTKKYVRGLLGICEEVNFSGRGEISYSSDEIERFKSPITFKIVDNILAIIPEEIPKNMFNAKFEFSRKDIANSAPEIIYTPKEDEFNLPAFLFSFADYFNSQLKPSLAHNPLENQLRQAKRKVIQKVGEASE